MDIPEDLRYNPDKEPEEPRDKYDEAIAYLCQHPEEMEFAHQFPGDSPIAGCLFMNAGHHPYLYIKLDGLGTRGGRWLSDPIGIREHPDRCRAETEEVTQMILDDDQLPSSFDECGLQHLPRLAYWQRRFDDWFKRRGIPDASGAKEHRGEEREAEPEPDGGDTPSQPEETP
jgi:hypothetical protein